MKQVVFLLLALAVLSCGKSSKNNFSSIEEGMTVNHVVKLIGNPDMKESLERYMINSEIWFYGDNYALQISNEKVVGITPDIKNLTKIIEAQQEARARGDLNAVIGYAKMLGGTEEQINKLLEENNLQLTKDE